MTDLRIKHTICLSLGRRERWELARKPGVTIKILSARFNVKFDHGELYEVANSREVRIVNNLPYGTLS